MNIDDLDRILTSEDLIEPSASFSENVMSRIQAEAAFSPQITFPLVCFVLAMIIATFLILPFFPSEAIVMALNAFFLKLGAWIVSPADMALRNAFLLVLVSLSGTMLLVWISLRLSGVER